MPARILTQHHEDLYAEQVIRELEALAPGDVFWFHSKRRHEAPTYLKVITKPEYDAAFADDDGE
jgi:hypothetical protein